jgi:hypothetical protein
VFALAMPEKCLRISALKNTQINNEHARISEVWKWTWKITE